ncbi:hypothetical protein BU23DRAFT_570414 [Bimuria novae-zelandiae CBS 107.79]|uniref:Uncharacterized protein n=1 Tax=Bimuria novae-zelandiae CBS 107.79 TaxID=1447943 RepID=A0A6A5V132_9PLEO|nr:hypothetical protein BU23DRAFT_570414 [Bimuria novae-zelandiae CBS 107.79]
MRKEAFLLCSEWKKDYPLDMWFTRSAVQNVLSNKIDTDFTESETNAYARPDLPKAAPKQKKPAISVLFCDNTSKAFEGLNVDNLSKLFKNFKENLQDNAEERNNLAIDTDETLASTTFEGLNIDNLSKLFKNLMDDPKNHAEESKTSTINTFEGLNVDNLSKLFKNFMADTKENAEERNASAVDTDETIASSNVERNLTEVTNLDSSPEDHSLPSNTDYAEALSHSGPD